MPSPVVAVHKRLIGRKQVERGIDRGQRTRQTVERQRAVVRQLLHEVLSGDEGLHVVDGNGRAGGDVYRIKVRVRSAIGVFTPR